MASSPQYRSRFGDTTMTKVFVGGLAWETPTEELRRYFEQFGDIVEAVIITDKNTGRSKGYGFVTFRDPESARLSVVDPNPMINGRRANCNIASLGRPRPSPPRGQSPMGSINQGPLQAGSKSYSRVPVQARPPPPPPPPPSVMYHPYGYMAYTTDYGGYQQAMYNPQIAPHYYHPMYGLASSSNVGPSGPYHYPHFGYALQSPRMNYPMGVQGPRPPYIQNPTAHMEGALPSSSLPHGFQLQAPPHVREAQSTTDSQNLQQSSTSGANADSTKA